MHSFLLLTRWNLTAQLMYLPLYLVVQVMLALGIVVGFAYLVPNLDSDTALLLSTGAPTLLLLTAGLVMLPQAVGQAKIEGSYDWFRTLPAPRWALLFSELVVALGVALPGIVIALGIAWLRYDLSLAVSPLVVPAALMVGFAASAVGYGMASLLPPKAAQLLSQVIIFAILLFSPINFPAERLPTWLASVHTVLPIEPMADVMRATLATTDFTVGVASVGVLVAWCLAGLAAALYAMNRRI